MWPILFDRCHLEISFGHRTFAWGSDARGVAHVHVVIIGLCRRDMEPAVKRLFSYSDIDGDPSESKHAALAPYLFDAGTVNNRHLVVRETPRPINGAPKMVIGSKPIDGGYLIFNDEENVEFLAREPAAAKFMRPYIGGVEYLHNHSRWILALQNATPPQLRQMPLVTERLKQVREYRKGERPPRKKQDDEEFDIKTPGISARALADTPAEFHVTVIPTHPFLAVPENTSHTRDYLPIGWLKPPIIPSNKLRFIKDATLWHFGILTSATHMAWLRDVGGRIKSDYQYGIGVVYNTFPWPEATDKQKEKISELAQAVLDARALYPDATLADLYDPTLMKRELRQAHKALDAAVDRLYRPSAFRGDRDRAEHLFGRYEKLVLPLMQITPTKRKRASTQL